MLICKWNIIYFRCIRLNKKELIFNLFSRNLVELFGETDNIYVCPICKTIYKKEDIHKKNLTIEHVIPNALNGKIYILLCKKCNSTCGYELDINLINKLEIEKFFKGKSNKPIKFTGEINNSIMRGDFIINEEKKLLFQMKSGLSKPEHEKKFCDMLINGDFSMNINGSFNYNEKKAEVAWLKISYLTLFRYLGYHMLQPSYDIIRNQLLNPLNDIYKLQFLTLDIQINSIVKLFSTVILDREYYIIIYNLNNNIRQRAILMPDPYDFEIIEHKNSSPNEKIKFNCKEIPFDSSCIPNIYEKIEKK